MSVVVPQAIGISLRNTQSVGAIACFAWQLLSMASYLGVPVVLLTMSFWAEPNYFPWLRKSGTYILKYYIFFNLV